MRSTKNILLFKQKLNGIISYAHKVLHAIVKVIVLHRLSYTGGRLVRYWCMAAGRMVLLLLGEDQSKDENSLELFREDGYFGVW